MSARRKDLRRGPRGNTLLELVVVMAILGIVAGVTELAFQTRSDRRLIEPALARVAEARRAAIERGLAVTVILVRDGDVMIATAHADGTVLADSSLGVDRLSGRAER